MEKITKVLAVALICTVLTFSVYVTYTYAFNSGYQNGQNDGFMNGYQNGRNEGYFQGFNETLKLLLKALQSQANVLNENSKTAYNLWVAKVSPTGQVTVLADEHNTITNIGERWERDLEGFANASGQLKYISWGNATTGATLTKLTTEATTAGFTRAAGTVTNYYSGSDYGWNVTISIPVTGTINLNAVGLHWDVTSNSDGNLFACGAISQTTFNNGDTAVLKWLVTKDDN